MTEDAELLRRYADEKSEQAFAELVQRHLGLVYACALRRVGGNQPLAEDITQQVFIDVARRAAILARRPVLAGWLFTSTRFAASKAMRTARRRIEREQEAQLMNDTLQDPTAQFDWEKARPVLDDAMEELNDRDREAILLRFFEGRDFLSIGTKLNLSDNAARMRVERALERLRTRLEHRGVTSTAVAIAGVLTQQTVVALPAGFATTVTSAALAGSGIAAGTTAAIGTPAAIAFMSALKLEIGITCALVAAATTGFVIQADDIAGLRTDMANLREQPTAVALLQAENRELQTTAAEVARLREDDVALARLQDEAAVLQTQLQELARKNPARATSVPRPAISRKTTEALDRLKPMQDAKDLSGMMSLLDSLISQVGPTSYDLALILDMKAKLHAMQGEHRKAIEPWEKALQLSDRYHYFDGKTSRDIAFFLAQLRYQEGLTTKLPPAPPARWF